MVQNNDSIPENDTTAAGGLGGPMEDLPPLSDSIPDVEVVDSHRFMGVDPVTGLVESRRGEKYVPTDQKVEFMLLLRRFWPNISKACALSGLSYRTYKRHLDLDLSFREQVESIKREVLDELEELGTGFASTPKGFMHWIAILKAHRPERWNPEQRLVIQHELAPEQARIKRDNLAQVIATDAEVIKATTGKKLPRLPDLQPIETKPEETAPPTDPNREPSRVAVDPIPEQPAAPQAGETQGKTPPTQELVQDDGSIALDGSLDNFGDFCNTSSADEYNPSDLARKPTAPKKPTG